MESGKIKELKIPTTYTATWLGDDVYEVCSDNPDEWFHDENGSGYLSALLEAETRYELTFGAQKSIFLRTCTNGSYSYDSQWNYELHDCDEPASSFTGGVAPLAILNKDNFLYRYRENSETATMVMPTEFGHPDNSGDPSKVITHQTMNSDWFSFYALERYFQYNYWRWRSYDSYSTEHGWLGCGDILLTDRMVGGRYLGWHRRYGLILFESCDNYERLNVAQMYFNDRRDDRVDVFIH